MKNKIAATCLAATLGIGAFGLVSLKDSDAHVIKRYDTHMTLRDSVATAKQLPSIEASTLVSGIITTDILRQADKTVLNVTGYTAGYESTGKYPGDPAYGRTASGLYVDRGVTVAAGKGLPFGTVVYIPHFDGKSGWDNDGIFTVHDRGGAISNGHMDVYFGESISALRAAQAFGRHDLEVYILDGGEYSHEQVRSAIVESKR